MDYINELAYQLIVYNRHLSFPIDLLELDYQRLGIIVGTYWEWREFLEAYKLADYAYQHMGVSLNIEGQVYILYDETISFAVRNLVLGHELGHIQCKHAINGAIIGYSDNRSLNNQQEREANRFADAMIAPAPVLALLPVRTPYDVQELTGLPMERARTIFADVAVERYSPSSAISKAVVKRFSRSINEQKIKHFRSITIIIVVFTAIFSLYVGWVLFRASVPVVTTMSDKQFHRTTCVTMQEKEVALLSTWQAYANGLHPCKLCEP